MATILVSIVSEQAIPNYLFIKEFQSCVDKFLFLSTDTMEKQKKTQLIWKTAGIDDKPIVKTNISEDILNQSIEKLNKLGLSRDHQYLVNLTGGTKMMAIAVWRFFNQFPNSRYFYVPINKGVYHELFEDKPSKETAFTYQVGINEYLQIYGIRYEHEDIVFNESEVYDIFKGVKAGGFDLDKFPKHQLRKLDLPDNNKKIHTKWFEEYTYYLIKKELQLTDKQIATGIKLYSMNEEKKHDQYPHDNEVDVLLMYRNRPYLIECKFSLGKDKINIDNLYEHIYKLAAINKRFGLSAQATIFTLSDLSQLNVSIQWRKPSNSMKQYQKQINKMSINKSKRRSKMRHKKLKLSAILLLGLGLTGLQAQTSVNATGGDASGSGGSVSYSVGQVVYTTNTGTNGSVAQGVQQPYEISVVTGLEEAKGITLSVTAYPNPTTDYLTLRIDEFEISNLSFQLYDMSGKLLQSEKITGNQTSIVMSNLVPANYFVKVTQGNKEVKTFKIIKN